MSISAPVASGSRRPARSVGALPRCGACACQGENSLLVAALAAMLLLPVAEILLRHLFKTGISGSSAIVQHLTLIVGMLGGAIAARDGRLLALSPCKRCSKAGAGTRRRSSAAALRRRSASSSASPACSMCWRVKPLGKILVYGIPVWVIQLILPLGFGLVALRLVWHASGTGAGAALALALAAAAGGRGDLGAGHAGAIDGSGAGGPGGGDVAGRAGVHRAGRRGADSVLGARAADPGRSAEALQPDHQRHAAQHSDLHPGGLFPGGKRRVETAGARVPGAGRAIPRRAGHRDGAGLRVLHLVHRRVGRDDSGAGRRADAGAAGGALFRTQRAGPADGRRVAGHAVPAVPAADSLRHRRQPQRPGQPEHQGDVPGRHRPRHPAGDHHRVVGHPQGAQRGRRPAGRSLVRSLGRALGRQVGIAHSRWSPLARCSRCRPRSKPPR